MTGIKQFRTAVRNDFVKRVRTMGDLREKIYRQGNCLLLPNRLSAGLNVPHTATERKTARNR